DVACRYAPDRRRRYPLLPRLQRLGTGATRRGTGTGFLDCLRLRFRPAVVRHRVGCHVEKGPRKHGRKVHRLLELSGRSAIELGIFSNLAKKAAVMDSFAMEIDKDKRDG